MAVGLKRLISTQQGIKEQNSWATWYEMCHPQVNRLQPPKLICLGLIKSSRGSMKMNSKDQMREKYQGNHVWFTFISSYNRKLLPRAVRFMNLLTAFYRNSVLPAFDLKETHLSVHQCPLASWIVAAWNSSLSDILNPALDTNVLCEANLLYSQSFLEKVDEKTQMRPCFTVWLSLYNRLQVEFGGKWGQESVTLRP